MWGIFCIFILTKDKKKKNLEFTMTIRLIWMSIARLAETKSSFAVRNCFLFGDKEWRNGKVFPPSWYICFFADVVSVAESIDFFLFFFLIFCKGKNWAVLRFKCGNDVFILLSFFFRLVMRRCSAVYSFGNLFRPT